VKIENQKRFLPEDYPGESAGFRNLLEALNDQFEQVVRVGQNNITFADNLQAEVIKGIQIVHQVQVEIKLRRLRGSPTFWFACVADTIETATMAVLPLGGGLVQIMLRYGAGSGSHLVNLVFFGE
jgi:hypothetical protein